MPHLDVQRPRIVLLVEDIPSVLHSSAELLRSQNYVVHTAATPEEAQAIIRLERLHLAVIDNRLRGNDIDDFSGFDLANNELLKRVPRIIYSQYPTSVLTELYARYRGRIKPANLDIRSKQEETIVEMVNAAFCWPKVVPDSWAIGINFTKLSVIAEDWGGWS